MANSYQEKRPFLFVDDYGSGVIWIYVTAANPSDVTKQYPRLKYVASKPAWLLMYEKQHPLLAFDLEAMHEELSYLSGKAD